MQIWIALEKELAAEANESRFSGVVFVQKSNQPLFAQAYGYANRGWKVPNTVNTRFRIASVGKLFTSVAVMQLAAKNQISLQTRIHDILQLSESAVPLETTVYHLLTMIAGIADWINEESDTYDEDWDQFCKDHPLYLLRSDKDYLPIFLKEKPYYPLGEGHHYSGASFMLLGLLIEKISGKSYFDYMREQIFMPAGMNQTDFLDLDHISPGVAEGYHPIMDETGSIKAWIKNYYRTTAGPAADGGATSTAEDLARFCASLRSGQLLDPRFANQLYTPHVVEGEDDELGFKWRYGFGCYVMLNQRDELVRWGHTGEEDGVSCRLWVYPQQDSTVVLLGNQSLCAGRVSRKVQSVVLGS